MLAKFHGNILNLSENILKSFRGLLFFTHTVDNELTCVKELNTETVSQEAHKVHHEVD